MGFWVYTGFFIYEELQDKNPLFFCRTCIHPLILRVARGRPKDLICREEVGCMDNRVD